MAKIRNAQTSITIVKPQQVQYKRTSSRYGKRKGTFSSHVQYLLVGRGTDGKFVSLRVWIDIEAQQCYRAVVPHK